MKTLLPLTLTVLAVMAPLSEATPQELSSRAESPVDRGLASISSSIPIGETIYVQKAGSRASDRLKGKFGGATDSSLAIETHEGLQTIPAGDVKRVWRQERTVTRGMLIGFITGAIVANTVMLSNAPKSDEYSTGLTMFVGTVAGGGTGLIYGAILGAFIHRDVEVYRADRHVHQILE